MSASIQSSHGDRPKGIKGGASNSNPLSTFNEVAGADVTVGTFCKISATGVVNLTAITDSISGCILRPSSYASETITSGKSATLVSRGGMFVYCETACTKGIKAFVRCVAGAGGEPVGNVRNDIDVNKAVQANVTFLETISSAGLVEVDINL